MRKSIFVVIAVLVIVIGIVWWGMNKGGWRDYIERIKIGGQTGEAEQREGGAEMELSRTREKTPEAAGEAGADTPQFVKRGLAIKVYKVARATFEDVLPSMGSIKGYVHRKLNFEIPGVIETIKFREGDLIKKSDMLARLRPKENMLKVDYNRAKLKSAMVQAAQAEKKLEMFRNLFDAGAINKLKLSEVEAETANAKHLAEAAQVELESAQVELQKTELRAPADCILNERNVEEGEFVSSYVQKAFEVMEIDTVFAETGIVERDVTKVKIGQLARVYVDAYADLPFDGIIDNIYQSLSEKTRTLPVEIKIDNARRMLMPGMFARAEIILFEKPGVMSIPRVAIRKMEESALVYVVDQQTNTAVERIVELGYESTDYIEIKRGLQEGDLVAITNVEGLTAGTPVQVTEIQIREM
ncbi:MAG: efflux RND transporter periplasmic adaptor subunit [Candidatus Omnitrophica bacterium]|nr:efflux RND transporter periplasmic adaptor subunit [Candidatus Omnitrophota bacterium]